MTTRPKKVSNKQTVAHAAMKTEGLVSDYPFSSVLVVFGIGLGVGVALGSLLGAPAVARPTFGQRTELAAEKIGRRMLDAITGALPETLSKHIAS